MSKAKRRAVAITGLGMSLAGALGLAAISPAHAGSGDASLPVVKNIGSPQFTSMGGASVLDTSRTVAHFHGAFTDPNNATTYGYNMVGADPSANLASTIKTEIIPIDVVFPDQGNYTLTGSGAAGAFANSPLYSSNTYTFGSKRDTTQYEDAVMRAQFAKLGSPYHLYLQNSAILPAQTLSVPKNHGFAALLGDAGVPGSLVDIQYFSTFIKNLVSSLNLDPTTLPIFATKNTFLYVGSLDNCCVLGYHGTQNVVGDGGGSANGSGNQPVMTFAWASYIMPGVWDNTKASINKSDPYDKYGTIYLQDIHGFSHEISEWGDDPFVNNTVEPWLTPTAPQYGCTSLLETGDPVVGIGFKVGSNPYPSSDGAWHPEDEVLLPWFARQNPSAADAGRYTFMGAANDYPGFHTVATGC